MFVRKKFYQKMIIMGQKFAIWVCLLIIFSFAGSCDQQPESPLKVLLLTGGGWHDYETQQQLLTEGVNEHLGESIEWTIVHEGEGEPDHHISVLQEENWAEGYDLVVHNTGFGRVTDSGFVARFTDYHTGTPAVLIHASVHSYRYAEPADPWFAFMGLKSMWHEDQRSFEVENLAPAHPVMENIPAGWSSPPDEIYVIEEVIGEITPLAQAYGQQTEEYQTVAWTHEVGDTRIFATTLGHNNETFEQEEFLEMVANGILWAAGRK